ncbi:hypothetical protein [Streptomyces gilvosporeus]|uniref:Uncharacterized protein n=1 Tax=Streptomyces gilvosporeus TaxID=553510 RepID=A0A1V0TT82_9ACTN|nr:hypothetical protein [Streptomyces gilvosporeus]ARF55968.1 hypothetical protein B1H19_18845 [Streptomyces gilvosporeus]
MASLIRRTLIRLQALLTPQGRHRAKAPSRQPRPVRPAQLARNTTHRPRRPGPYAIDSPIDGDATVMVRPYLLALSAEAAR